MENKKNYNDKESQNFLNGNTSVMINCQDKEWSLYFSDFVDLFNKECSNRKMEKTKYYVKEIPILSRGVMNSISDNEIHYLYPLNKNLELQNMLKILREESGIPDLQFKEPYLSIEFQNIP